MATVGPLLGQLYWAGYLGEFGLTPQEFPLADAEVRTYAFLVVVHATLWMWGAATVIALLAATSALTGAMLGLMSGLRSVGRFWGVVRLRFLTWVDADKRAVIVLQAIAALAGSTLFGLLLFGAVAVVVVILLSPWSATDVGARDALTTLNEFRAAEAGSAQKPCATVKTEFTTFSCPRIVTFGKDYLAVYEKGVIFRVPRSNAYITTPLTTKTGGVAK